MELCEENHDAIVFEGKSCPLCEVIDENEGLHESIENLEGKVAELQEEIDEHQCEEEKK